MTRNYRYKLGIDDDETTIDTCGRAAGGCAGDGGRVCEGSGEGDGCISSGRKCDHFNGFRRRDGLDEWNAHSFIDAAGVSLTEDHEAVVGAGTDESGIADAVCVKKGSPSLKTPIISDIPLEAGDRLTDFVEIDYDPAIGETMYACWLEY